MRVHQWRLECHLQKVKTYVKSRWKQFWFTLSSSENTCINKNHSRNNLSPLLKVFWFKKTWQGSTPFPVATLKAASNFQTNWPQIWSMAIQIFTRVKTSEAKARKESCYMKLAPKIETKNELHIWIDAQPYLAFHTFKHGLYGYSVTMSFKQQRQKGTHNLGRVQIHLRRKRGCLQWMIHLWAPHFHRKTSKESIQNVWSVMAQFALL